MTLEFDTSDLMRLSVDIGKASRATTGLVFGAFKASAVDTRTTWARNATETAGKHGKHYPKSITEDARLGFNIEFEIGPDPRLPQGGMNFEYGSVNQPPHLDGQRAMDEVTPRHIKRVEDAVDGIAAAIETGAIRKSAYTTRDGRTIMATDAQISNWTRGSRS